MDDDDLPFGQGSDVSTLSPWSSSSYTSASTSTSDTPVASSPWRNRRFVRGARIRRDAIVLTAMSVLDLDYRCRETWFGFFEPEVTGVITHPPRPITSGSQTPGLTGIYSSAGLRSGARTPAMPASTPGYHTPLSRRPIAEPFAPPRTSSSSDGDLRVANPEMRAAQNLGTVNSSHVQSAARELRLGDRQAAVTMLRQLGVITPSYTGRKRVLKARPMAPRRHAKRRRSLAPGTPVNLRTTMETVLQSSMIADQHLSNGRFADQAEMLVSGFRESVRSLDSLDVVQIPEALESHPEVSDGVIQARILDGSHASQLQMAGVIGNLLQCIARCQADARRIIMQQRNSVRVIVVSTRVLSNPSLVEIISSYIPIQERLRVVCAVAGLVRQPVDVIYPQLRSLVTEELWRLEHLLDQLQALYRELETYRDLHEPEDQGADLVTVRCPEIVDLVEYVATLQRHVESPVALPLNHAHKRVARKVLRLIVLQACKEVYQETPRDQLGHRGSIRTAAVYERVLADSGVRFFWRRPHLFVKHEITAILYELCNDDWAWYQWSNRFEMNDAWLVVPVFGGESEIDLD